MRLAPPRRVAPAAALCLLATGIAAVAQQPSPIQSPNGNIRCAFGATRPSEAEPPIGQVRCEMAEFRPVWPDPPEGCDLDWGGAMQMTETGPPRRSCHGDSLFGPDAPEAKVMPFSHRVEAGGLTCWFERNGLTCTNRFGSGFFMSKTRQKMF